MKMINDLYTPSPQYKSRIFSFSQLGNALVFDTPELFLQASVTGLKPLPVRPGMFLETVSKVSLASICDCGLLVYTDSEYG